MANNPNKASGTNSTNSGDGHGPHPEPDQIRSRAYELWQTRGCPDGLSLDHWLEAEAALRAQTIRIGKPKPAVLTPTIPRNVANNTTVTPVPTASARA
jgi:hypothetical protein